MREGEPWIYQAVLEHGVWKEVPDLLRREDALSALGDFSYAPVDIKGHKEATTKDKVQLAAYALLLEPLLGHRSSSGGVWTNTGEIDEVDLEELEDDLESLARELIALGTVWCRRDRSAAPSAAPAPGPQPAASAGRRRRASACCTG